MRYLIALIVGIVVGGAIAAGFVYYNPFVSQVAQSLSSRSDQQQMNLSYSVVADHSIIYTNSGESFRKPHPSKVLHLWEAPIRQTEVMATMMRDNNDAPVGFGIKFSSRSEQTRILNGKALIDSVWYVYLPQQGTMLVAQSENYWNYLHNIVVPARWNSGNAWKGDWAGTITNGPGELGTARVYGGSGTLAGLDTGAVETLSAKAYSSELGPVSMDGRLTIELPAGSGPDQTSKLAAEIAR